MSLNYLLPVQIGTTNSKLKIKGSVREKYKWV